MSRIEQKDYWNAVAEEKKFTLPLRHDLFSSLLTAQAQILDVGCGYGRTLQELNALGYKHLTGLDFSQEMIRKGNRLYPDLDLRVLESPRLPFSDQSFDAVILFAVLTCIEKNEDQLFLFDEIHRLLKPGGHVIVSDFLINADSRNLARYKKFKDTYSHYGTFQLPKGGVCRHHRMDWVKESTSSFTTIHLEESNHTTMNGNPSRGYYFIGQK
jgi:SAM-dependent methyltransferase